MSLQINTTKFIIGIDEVGRGPIAGPVAVGACVLLKPELCKRFRKFKDSKQLTEKLREKWYGRIQEAREQGILQYSVVFVSEQIIDTKGLSFSIKHALSSALENLQCNPEVSTVLLDGGLRAPKEYKDQTTIIKGDEKELAIALASIVAKVERDRKMVEVGQKYPGYGFEEHKGYATRKHFLALKNKGILPIHRRSFLRNFYAKVVS